MDNNMSGETQAISDDQFKRMMSMRPFDPERDQPIVNEDGSLTTELTTTSQLEDGSWVNHPTVWFDDEGRGNHLSEDESREIVKMREAFGNEPYQRFKSVEEAVEAAKGRSNADGGYNNK